MGDFDNDGVLEVVQAAGFVKGNTDRWPELHELAMGNDSLVRKPASWPQFHPGDDLSGNDYNHFFVRSGRGFYVDLSRDLGLDDPQRTRGIATADFDGDGLLDFAIANQWEDSVFYHNQTKKAGNFLQLYLMLPTNNSGPAPSRVYAGYPSRDLRGRYAIGATATLYLPDGRRMIAQVEVGNGHSGKRSPELHFGLGSLPASVMLPVELSWRDANGGKHRETMNFSPGLHTILLGSSEERHHDVE
jgi:hypothetical protein